MGGMNTDKARDYLKSVRDGKAKIQGLLAYDIHAALAESNLAHDRAARGDGIQDVNVWIVADEVARAEAAALLLGEMDNTHVIIYRGESPTPDTEPDIVIYFCLTSYRKI